MILIGSSDLRIPLSGHLNILYIQICLGVVFHVDFTSPRVPLAETTQALPDPPFKTYEGWSHRPFEAETSDLGAHSAAEDEVDFAGSGDGR